MEFKTPNGKMEIEPHRDGKLFSHNGLILHTENDLWLEIDGRKYKTEAVKVGDTWWVHFMGHTLQFEVVEPGASGAEEDGNLTAPMPGKVLEVFVKEGQQVSAGDQLLIMEAMKMEHKIIADKDAVVETIHFNAGDQVTQGAELIKLSD